MNTGRLSESQFNLDPSGTFPVCMQPTERRDYFVSNRQGDRIADVHRAIYAGRQSAQHHFSRLGRSPLRPDPKWFLLLPIRKPKSMTDVQHIGRIVFRLDGFYRRSALMWSNLAHYQHDPDLGGCMEACHLSWFRRLISAEFRKVSLKQGLCLLLALACVRLIDDPVLGPGDHWNHCRNCDGPLGSGRSRRRSHSNERQHRCRQQHDY